MSPQAVVKLVEELKDKYTVDLICSCLNVPISTYYRWKKKDFSPTVIEKTIGKICKKNKFIYGYRKIKYLIQKELNQVVNHKVVQRIMQKNGWNCAVRPKKAIKIGKPFSITDNTLNRNFSADKPMQKLTTDITYLPFGPKRLYLSSIMDLHNGEILAYTIGPKQDTKFVLDTLNQIDLSKEFYYIVIKAAFILLLNTTTYIKKKALSAVCTVRGLPQIMHPSKASILPYRTKLST